MNSPIPRRFYYALVLSATICVVVTRILNCSGIAVQWNGGLSLAGRGILVKMRITLEPQDIFFIIFGMLNIVLILGCITVTRHQ